MRVGFCGAEGVEAGGVIVVEVAPKVRDMDWSELFAIAFGEDLLASR